VRQQQLLGSKGTLSSHVLLTADGDSTTAAAADPSNLNAQQSSTAGASAGTAGFGSGQYAGGSFGGGLLSHSLVVQTGLGSYVQVRANPPYSNACFQCMLLNTERSVVHTGLGSCVQVRAGLFYLDARFFNASC
jgi:hypothetical protein